MGYKSIIVLLVLSLSFSVSYAQKNKRKKGEEIKIEVPEVPRDASQKVVYSGGGTCTGPSSELHTKALSWFRGFYRNPSDVVRQKDPETGKVEGKARFKIKDENAETGVITQAGLVMYEIVVEIKGGNFTYEISNINWKKSTPFPVERWIDENAKEYNKNYATYIVQMDEYMNDLIKKLSVHMGS